MIQPSSRSAFLTTVGAGLAGVAVPRIARAQTTQVRVGGVLSDLFAEPFYAKASGVFAKQGLDIEPTNLFNAGAVAAAIGGGTLEMGMGDLISGVNAIIAGIPIVLIAGGGLYRTPADRADNILAVTNDSPIKSPKDLLGKVIGVPTLVGVTTACLRAYLPTFGIAESQVKLVEVPPTTVPAALQRGTIDAGLLSEPFVTEFKGQVRAAGYPFDAAAGLAHGKAVCISVWYASKAWIEADRARAHNVVDAIYQTARWANSHQNETFDILVQSGKLDASKIQGMKRVTFATSLSPDLVQPVITIAENLKMFAKPVTAESLITTV
jgi:NitT/TauT family transport system substrate-binding protein